MRFRTSYAIPVLIVKINNTHNYSYITIRTNFLTINLVTRANFNALLRDLIHYYSRFCCKTVYNRSPHCQCVCSYNTPTFVFSALISYTPSCAEPLLSTLISYTPSHSPPFPPHHSLITLISYTPSHSPPFSPHYSLSTLISRSTTYR